MARRRSRIEGLRASFVVTAAMGAAACGGSTNDVAGTQGAGNGAAGGANAAGGAGGAASGGGGGTGNIFNGNGGILNPPPPTTTCPPAMPTPNTYCNYTGPECDYQFCGTFATQFASCVNFVWQVGQGSCNPPPPPTTTCPQGPPPVSGSYCNYQGPSCIYPVPQDGGTCPLQLYADCAGYSWTLKTIAPPCLPPVRDGAVGD
jgi:hypothetical protein